MATTSMFCCKVHLGCNIKQKQASGQNINSDSSGSWISSQREIQNHRTNYSQWWPIKRRCQCVSLRSDVSAWAEPEAQNIWYRESPSAGWLLIRPHGKRSDPCLCVFSLKEEYKWPHTPDTLNLSLFKLRFKKSITFVRFASSLHQMWTQRMVAATETFLFISADTVINMPLMGSPRALALQPAPRPLVSQSSGFNFVNHYMVDLPQWKHVAWGFPTLHWCSFR